MKSSALLGLAAILVLLASPTEAAREDRTGVIQLTRADDIRLASAMEEAIGRMSGKVMRCVQGKLAPPAKCFCRYPKALSDVESVYAATIEKRPQWKGGAVSYSSGGITHLVSLSGVARQLAVKCSVRH